MAETVRGQELRSRITSAGELVLNLEAVTLSAPGPDEVIVQVQAAPINPSDIGLLLGPADMATLKAAGPGLHATVPAARLRGLALRLDQSMPVGNEGAGVVIAAGANVHAMQGKMVAMRGGGMYTQYRKLPAQDCVVLPAGMEAVDGAAMFVNPLTVLAMVETMRREGHKAMVHTAAASNLGQMLVKVCAAEGVPLVNIVRSAEQVALLRGLGAAYALNSEAPDFRDALTDALAETGATVAFDAIGGGKLANAILHAMEAAANRNATVYSRYGSNTFKQVYVYGMLDVGPTTIDRGYGFQWGVCGFLLTPFLERVGPEVRGKMVARVAKELKTTFASSYTDTISLADALKPEIVTAYTRKATGRKYLIDPRR